MTDPRSDREMAIRLEWATIAWNLGEFFVTVALGVVSGSLALVAFGVDSLIEVFASGVVVWHEQRSGEASQSNTRIAHRLIAGAFFALALALALSATRRLWLGTSADASPLGIAYLTLVVIVMGVLAVWKQRLAVRLESSPLAAEARVTYLDAVLAFSVLLALIINARYSVWWVDPVAALGVAVVAGREGFENLTTAMVGTADESVSDFDSNPPIRHDETS